MYFRPWPITAIKSKFIHIHNVFSYVLSFMRQVQGQKNAVISVLLLKILLLVMAVVANILLILAAIVTKLSSSIDDIVWLLPFVSPTNKTKKKQLLMAVVYIAVMCLVTVCAIAISIGGRRFIQFIINDDESYWTAERILALISGIVLFLYSMYLLYDWYKELKEEKENESEDDNNPEIRHTQLPSQSAIDTTNNSEDEHEDETVEMVSTQDQESTQQQQENDAKGNKITIGRLIIVAILGSLDDFAVQCALLLGDTFTWYQLLIGIFIGSVIVVGLCVGIGYVKCIVKYVEKIPIWCIILILAIYTIISAFVDM